MEASDLHVVAGYPPVLRIHGELRQLDYPTIDNDVVPGLLVPLCPPHATARFQADRNVDFALELALPDRRQRLRANYFMSGRQMGACFRLIPSAIPDFEWAGFPGKVAKKLTHFRNGLVLVGGVVGSGKTTTLAMLIHLLNQEGGYRIITVEEPVEYLFPKMSSSVVTQREVGPDVNTFADGLKYALRQDPDVILVGRDSRSGDGADGAQCGRNGQPRLFHLAHPRRQGGHFPLCRPLPAERPGRGPRRSPP